LGVEVEEETTEVFFGAFDAAVIGDEVMTPLRE
jgi:hypothetical protein